ncbi:MAG TPA: bifunctional glutamate N-acetyltransferase/amino-acid acetyltransferase ArgJ [Acidobacteriaceae bacterium]|nr:bifunctional glutamate N-acetyltransferase/amino-acid acetyltransferase ArgJ [Acidobacteriaceae bacterium]
MTDTHSTNLILTPADGKLPLGFQWAATKAGIKASGNLDLALAVAPAGATAAVMYTKNQVVAAPVTVGREHIAHSKGRMQAVLINSGNANCANGAQGIAACRTSCDALANALGCTPQEIFPSSTGIIGVPLPAEKLTAAIPAAIAVLASDAEAAKLFARAIMTTDTKPKTALSSFVVDGASGKKKTVHIFGACKGAGMIGPQVGPPHATMLVYLFTDIGACAEELRAILQTAVEPSFNSISIDGDTSTNDTVLLLASGASGVTMNEARAEFKHALDAVCQSLAYQIIDDGEGVTHIVTLNITGARTEAEARQVARTIANSPLCKTAWSSGDPNWGRILAAAGYSGVSFDPARVNIHIGPYPVFEHGMRSPAFDEAATHKHMLEREYSIHFDLGQGAEGCRFITCDLTAEYVSINADYST